MSHYETRQISNAERLTVLFYGVPVFLFAGGFGVYFPVLVDRSISPESLATYAIAALAPLIADIFIPENYWKELSILGRMKVGLMIAVGALLAVAALFRNNKSYDMTLAVFATFAVLCLLYHTCILSGKFKPEEPPKTEDGGPTPSVTKLVGGGLE